MTRVLLFSANLANNVDRDSKDKYTKINGFCLERSHFSDALRL